ncbi:molecular chaperone DjiA [Nioella nitratireducens]|uniref:molecular chaperone DjiA n=1 Tax=Nioella nitratireducens TaxID=1287720 RepID=UPI0008FCE360|nr:DnaJ family molecular chaperone [Nioella nitratireducens]
MSFWSHLLKRLQAIRHDLGNWFRPPDPTSSVDFSIAFIALAAKLAKADGRVSVSEVVMFRRIIDIPPEEERNAARVYDLCARHVGGYEHYARQIWGLIRGHDNADEVRMNLVDGLFHIALADGEYHPQEDRFLREVARILEMGADQFEQLRARHVPEAWSPYAVLGLAPNASTHDVRASWKRLARENHPDLLISKGLPPELIRIAETRLRDINRAYDELRSGLELRM